MEFGYRGSGKSDRSDRSDGSDESDGSDGSDGSDHPAPQTLNANPYAPDSKGLPLSRIFLSAGESSGDMHGANLIRALRREALDVACEGLGGSRMAEAGMALRCDLAGRAIMGFAEVVQSFPYLRRVFLDTVAHLERTRPDCLVTIDYPGFNMRLAERAKAMGIPVATTSARRSGHGRRGGFTGSRGQWTRCWSSSLLKKRCNGRSAWNASTSAIHCWIRFKQFP